MSYENKSNKTIIFTLATVLKIDRKGAWRTRADTGYFGSIAKSIDGPVPKECPYLFRF
jgi:hypothetical protein